MVGHQQMRNKTAASDSSPISTDSPYNDIDIIVKTIRKTQCLKQEPSPSENDEKESIEEENIGEVTEELLPTIDT